MENLNLLIKMTWQNREKIINLCKKKGACKEEYMLLVKANTEEKFLNVLAKNFNWCIEHKILTEEWIGLENCNVKIFDCSYCPNLKEIPKIKGLKELYCSNCSNLKEIPNIKGLKKLDCSFCSNLKEIPNIKGLKKLDCSYCPNLKEIPNIKGCKII